MRFLISTPQTFRLSVAAKIQILNYIETSAAASPNSSTSFVIKCLLKTVRFMWQVTALPTKIGETIGTLYRYAQTSVDSILCVAAGKARRKERDGDQNSTDTKLYLEESVLERKLPEADLKALVDLPAGLDYNEWLASHTLALFEHVNLVYGTISEFCTPSGCADMTGPGNRTYLWFDEKGKKTRVAAPQYIDYVMTFTQKTVSDESIFPTKYANEFPSSFESIARKILRLQFHVIAHLYAAHFREIALLGLHTHLNLTFAHLTALHRRFNLIDEKETDVLRDLEVALRLTDDTNSSSTTQVDHETASASESGAKTAEDVNLTTVQHNNIAPAGVAASLIDSNVTATLPICTQPEAAMKTQQQPFGGVAGGGGLMGGILGDLSTGEFGYCTSAVPASSSSNSSPSCTSHNACNATADQCGGTSSSMSITANGNNGAGAGALYLNFHNSNNNNNHHHHHHNNHIPHHIHHQNHYAQNSGLIQCNASNAPSSVATTSTTTA
ncbi:MOB kinase activator-like 2 isoform X5 [Glossina fuscipes]|uniref:MOB kinase activator-like 2 n=1 Tax=Glossina fuscipes TaxID=7396 RepID=A0A8U0W2K0_9MUSC|nr:MOB kinase activator-like 2 isoform X5 [Glossina fuscipes]